MSRPRSFSARLSAAGAASLAALSLLVTSLTPPLHREQVQLMRVRNRLTSQPPRKLSQPRLGLRTLPLLPTTLGLGTKTPLSMLAPRRRVLRLLLRISLVPAALAPSKMTPQPLQ